MDLLDWVKRRVKFPSVEDIIFFIVGLLAAATAFDEILRWLGSLI